MKLGIMQPYFFPYIGYFQLINAVDKYVIYDDVNYIKSGWINRNRILLNNRDFLLNLNLKESSSFKKINEIVIGNNGDKLLKTITQAYKKAPHYSQAYPLIEQIINYSGNNLAKFLANSIILVSEYLGIKTEFVVSSDLQKNNELKGQDKVISICKTLNASEYYNAIGGQELYSKNTFEEKSIKLFFLKTNPIHYKQFDNEFIPNLSIIDVIMFNSPQQINKMLNEYELL